jgi:hypothetical protein
VRRAAGGICRAAGGCTGLLGASAGSAGGVRRSAGGVRRLLGASAGLLGGVQSCWKAHRVAGSFCRGVHMAARVVRRAAKGG